eukprot:12903276-Prorocentrum_lima.AAC.1
MSAMHLTPDEVLEDVPIILPTAHLLKIGDGLTGITQYPIDDRVKQGQPCITQPHGSSYA